jgi:glycosyltransferase involved in cell wall biosynthesis
MSRGVTDRPRVTFFIPCYKLAHLLPECVNSMLMQTYRDFEILIMDDCSPDDTPEVARSFTDPRVKHIRNEPNLGHLRNYNKAIGLARGDYIWLVSADDRLRSAHVLERYLGVMEANRRIGFAFCPGISIQDGRDAGIVPWARLDEPNTVIGGRTLLRRLVRANCVLAPSGMVRRDCYERLGGFPLDLPFAGDWFLWCLFALHYDVAYFAEPMVDYREHSGSMTGAMIADDIRRLSADDFAVRWRMLERIRQVGDDALARDCMDAIVDDYTNSLAGKSWRGTKYRMRLEEFERSLALYAPDAGEREQVRRTVLAGVGKHLYWDSELETDLQLFQLALEHGAFNPKLLVKYSLLRLGRPGVLAMHVMSTARAMSSQRRKSAS